MVAVGKVSKLYGVEDGGGLAINLYDTFPTDHTTEEPLFVIVDELAVPLYLERFERRGTRGALVEFADFDTRRRAEMLVGKELFVADSGEQTADDEEFYMEDLVGFAATVKSAGAKAQRGTLTDYINSDTNPLFEVTIDGAAHLIPAVEEFIARINFERKTIAFVLPEGIIGLNN